MRERMSRVLIMMLMMLAMLTPATIAAQESSPVASPMATPVTAPGLRAAVEWLISQQQEDGSWLGYSGEPDAGTTIDSIIALGAAREAEIDVGGAIESAVAWLGTDDNAANYAETGVGQVAKLVLALVAADAESMEIGGIFPMDLLADGQDPETGLYGTGLYDHAYVLMALAATDSDVPANAIEFFATVQSSNGGFAWDGSTDEDMVDSNTTAMVVQALVAVGEGEDDVVAGGVGYLLTTITGQGASYSIGEEADANSTALVAQALLAVGEDVTHLETTLSTFQNPNGAVHWTLDDISDNVFSTAQAIPALAGVTLPVIPGMLDMEEAA